MRDKEPIRIMRIIARLNIGGPAIQAISLSSDLPKDQYKTLLVSGKVGPNEGDMSYLAKEKDVHPHILAGLGREISPLDDIRSFLALRQMILAFKPQIIHTHTAKAGTLGRLAGISCNLPRRARGKIKLVHTFHGHIFHSYFSLWKTLLFIHIERILAKFTDRIIVISPLQRHDISARFAITSREKVRMIPLGFDLTKFGTSQKNGDNIRGKYFPTVAEDVLWVGIIGRLTPVKNHRMFLDAVRHLHDGGKSGLFKFLIIGDGELKAELIKYCAEIGVQQSVAFTGWQKEMASIYRALDVVVLTSYNEGTPVTLIEAMAAAKFFVATDVGGVRDLLGVIDESSVNGYKLAQNGILIPSEEPEALAKALSYLADHREMMKKKGKEAQRWVEIHYSMKRLIEDIDVLYQELIDR